MDSARWRGERSVCDLALFLLLLGLLKKFHRNYDIFRHFLIAQNASIFYLYAPKYYQIRLCMTINHATTFCVHMPMRVYIPKVTHRLYGCTGSRVSQLCMWVDIKV